MPHAVTDTHALIWYLTGDARLSTTARRWFTECLTDGSRIRIPSISVVEIIYLSERGRIPANTMAALLDQFTAPGSIFEVVELDLSVAMELANVNWAAVPDMSDRIIAATALQWRLPLITRDHRITSLGLTTIW